MSGRKPFKFNLQLFADDLPLPNDPSQIVVDPVGLGIAPEPQYIPDDEPPDEMMMMRQQLDQERQRVADAQRGLHDMSQQLAQNNALMHNLMLQNQNPNSNGEQQPAAAQGQSWEEYLNGGNNVTQPTNGKQPEFISRVEAERIADERIANTLNMVQQTQNTGAGLLNDFRSNHPDLHPYHNIVKEVYAGAVGQVGQVQAYNYAISKVREMVQNGQIPQAQPQPQPNGYRGPATNPLGPHGLLPSSPRGGQNNAWQTTASQNGAQQPVRYDENFVKNELSSMTEERRRLQAAKMAR